MKTLSIRPGAQADSLCLVSDPHIVCEVHSRTHAPVNREALTQAHAARLAACWNACHGLDIPESVPPGILADVVTVSRDLAAWLVAPDTSKDTLEHFRVRLEAVLAKLSTPAAGTPGPAPVSRRPDADIQHCDDDLLINWRAIDPDGNMYAAAGGVTEDRDKAAATVSGIGYKEARERAIARYGPDAGVYAESRNAAPVSPPVEIPPDRRAVWSFEVDGAHVRWCGTIEQFHADCTAYVDASQGTWENMGRRHLVFTDSGDKTKTHFRAVAAK